ncbi:MAG: hypothetical protein HZT39_09835 [Pseudoxanthomonas sp.]|nr:MAG: hypothetical protein HZT39_09835 [Pseudoxanthomonas sp.]
MKPWRHSANDGRGRRAVYLNGELIDRVVYADERRGIVKVIDSPIRLNRRRDGIITHVRRGRVEVRPL